MQKGREGREGKKRGDCVTRCLLLLSHSWAFTEGKTRIEDPRTSGILMKFLPLPSAISGKEGEDPSLFVSLSFSFSSLSKRFREGFDSIGRLYSQFLDEPWPWKIGNGRGVLDTVFPDANHICLLFREEKRRGGREIETSSIWKIMKRYFDCVLSLVETVGEAGQFFGYRRNRTVNLNRINLE